MNFEDMKNPEFQEKLKAAKTPEELVALAKEEGLALTDEQIEAISDGWGATMTASTTATTRRGT